MADYLVKECESGDSDFILGKLVEYNLSQVPSIQSSNYMNLSKKIIADNGTIIAGILCDFHAWGGLHIDILWVDEVHRKSGLGSKILKEVETIAKARGCHLVHLDTFDFQAKDFYLKNGYEIFGVLDDCPLGHKRYFLKKYL